MTQVARLGIVSAKLTTGAFGHDPTEVTDDIEPPPDRGPDSHMEVPVAVSGGTIALEQGDFAGPNATGASNVSLPAPPTAGNLLLLIAAQRAAAASTIIQPSGFGVIASKDHPSAVDGRALVYSAKVSDGTEQTVTFGGTNPPNSAVYLEVSGFGGVIPDIADVAYDDFSGVDSAVVPAVTLAGGIAAFVLAAMWKKTAGPNPGPASLTGYTTGPDTGFFGTGDRMRLTSWYVETNSSSTSYGGGTVTFTPASSCDGVTINIALTQGDTVWVPAPAVNDENDATYDSVDAAYTEVLHVDMEDAFRLSGARLLIGSSTAGSATYSIEGANEADFSDAVTLDTQTFTAAGSFATNEVLFEFPALTAYQYYRLIGPGDDIRLYTLELFEPQPVTEHEALQGRSDPEQHPADAVSYDNGYSGMVATDVQAALDELSAGGGGGGGAIELQEDGVTRTATMATLNVRHGLDADSSGNVDVDEGELSHASLANLTTGDPHTQYALESAIVPAAGPDADVTVDTAGAAGTASTYARSGHGHQLVTTAGPGADATIDGTGAAGATGTAARAGHGHKVVTDTGVASTQAFGDSATAGTSGTIQRGGHKHAMPANPTVGLSMLLPFKFDGGGAALAVGAKAYLPNLIAGTITRATIVCDTGTVTLEFKKSSYSGFQGSLASITGGGGLALTTGTKVFDATLSGWSLGITDDDVIEASITAVSGATKVTGVLRATRT